MLLSYFSGCPDNRKSFENLDEALPDSTYPYSPIMTASTHLDPKPQTLDPKAKKPISPSHPPLSQPEALKP